MSNIEIHFISILESTLELKQQFDTLDNLAFSVDQHKDVSEFNNIEWNSKCDWFVLGWLDTKLVTQLCLVEREIVIGCEKVWVMGVGGVATHPVWQGKGFATILLNATKNFIQKERCIHFGLLVCADKTRHLYERVGWKQVAHELTFVQNGEHRLLKTAVMGLTIANNTWPTGAINLCGAPW